MANRVDPDRSSLFWFHPVCFAGSNLFASILRFVSNVRQSFAADDLADAIFQMHFFFAL